MMQYWIDVAAAKKGDFRRVDVGHRDGRPGRGKSPKLVRGSVEKVETSFGHSTAPSFAVAWEGGILLERKRSMTSIAGYWRRSNVFGYSRRPVSRVGVVVAPVLDRGWGFCHWSASCCCILAIIAKDGR